MAISHVQPLIFLLVSLSCLPALHAIDFQYCNDIGYSYGNITRVEISPDDYPTVTIFGYSSDEAKTIDVGTITVGITNFNFTLSGFPWDDKPPNGKFALTLTDKYGASGKPVDRMCIYLDDGLDAEGDVEQQVNDDAEVAPRYSAKETKHEVLGLAKSSDLSLLF